MKFPEGIPFLLKKNLIFSYKEILEQIFPGVFFGSKLGAMKGLEDKSGCLFHPQRTYISAFLSP